MKEGPDISATAALIGDPARANMLAALMGGQALTATELAGEAGITLQTASGHLRKLEDGGLVAARKQGRHKYFALADGRAAALLEALMGFAAARGALRHRPGPRDPALRAARVCYNHLAGEAGVQLYDSLQARGFLVTGPEGLRLAPEGTEFISGLGLDLAALPGGRAPLCRDCLDWSERRTHLAGRLGRGLFEHMQRLGWLERMADSRAVRFRRGGRSAFDVAFPPVSA